jgi:hypothetical protein
MQLTNTCKATKEMDQREMVDIQLDELLGKR